MRGVIINSFIRTQQHSGGPPAVRQLAESAIFAPSLGWVLVGLAVGSGGAGRRGGAGVPPPPRKGLNNMTSLPNEQ